MTIDEIIATHEIIDRLKLYCRSMDRMDNELGFSLWTEDAVLDYGDIYQGGGRAFIERANRLHADLLATKHRYTNHLVRVSGDEAVSESDGRVTLVSRDEEGWLVRQSFGRYLDQWVRRDGQWLIRHRRYHRDFALFSRPADVTLGPGRRDRDDFSYEFFPTA
jgi:hypothetical protein